MLRLQLSMTFSLYLFYLLSKKLFPLCSLLIEQVHLALFDLAMHGREFGNDG